MAEREKFAHLLRRATFGPTAQEVDAAERAGFAETVQGLLTPAGEDPVTPPALGTDPFAAITRASSREERQAARKARNEQVQQLTAWWLRRMVAARHGFGEKLVFFWHGHWATSVQKVDSAQLMLKQLNTFRAYGRGGFAALVKAMLRDPALIIWLDGQRNTRKAPNENLARELMELFTLGIGSGYTENDVKAAARALTGWALERATGQVRLEPGRFDDGEKTILGRTERFDADGLADLLVAQPVSARFLASRLWFRFAQDDVVPEEAAQRMVDAYGADRDVTAMARAMFHDPMFATTRGQLVKQPVEWLVGAVRQLEVGVDDQVDVLKGLNALDQVPLRPPSVGGWPSGAAWLTTFALQTKLRLAQALAAKASAAVVDRLTAAPEAGRPEALARLLVVDAWSEATRGVLASTKDPRRLLTIGLASPEYTIS